MRETHNEQHTQTLRKKPTTLRQTRNETEKTHGDCFVFLENFD